MKWILIIAWAANGTGYTFQEFDSLKACQIAEKWAHEQSSRGPSSSVCINKATGEMK